MSESRGFQDQAHMFALRAADRLRNAASKLETVYTGDVLLDDTMRAIEVVRSEVFDAYSCLGHASHQHALAVLHREREKRAAS